MTDSLNQSYSFRVSECQTLNRLDPFHFDPRFDALMGVVGACPPSLIKNLSDVADLSSATVDPRKSPDTVFTYVEIEGVNPATGELVKWSRVRGGDAPSRARRVIATNSILLSTVRPIRRAIAIAPDEVIGGVCSTGFSVVVPRERAVERGYLWAFLRCKYGASQLERLGRGASYPALLEDEIEQLLVVVPPRPVRDAISGQVKKALELKDRANIERLKAIGEFEALIPPDTSVEGIVQSTMTSEECRQRARLDPKYFAQRYRNHMDVLDRLTCKRLEELVTTSIHRGAQPVTEGEKRIIPVLNTKTVQNKRVEWGIARKVSEEFFTETAQGQVLTDDIVVTCTGIGSWGRAAICDLPRAFGDGHVAILRVDKKKIDPHVLLAFLWSKDSALQIEQRVRGSTRQLELYVEDLKQVAVPDLPTVTIRKVKKAMASYFDLLKEADQQRDGAVQAVEQFTERGGK
jgi:restriction endonuclease S subunit